MKNNTGRIAVVDIGSNSVRLFIFDVTGDKAREISSLKFLCGLGKDLGITGRLNPHSVSLTHRALDDFRVEVAKHDIDAEIVVGTAALREAKDAEEFIADVKNRSGFSIRIIEGRDEARFAALAILAEDPDATGVVADFGGGSLELAALRNGGIEDTVSMRLGAHYLKALKNPQDIIERKLAPALAANPALTNPASLYVIGGSWRSLAKAWLFENGKTFSPSEHSAIPADELRLFCDDIGKREPEALIERYKMEAPRAALMEVSALMLGKLIEKLGPEVVKASNAGIRDGLAYDYIKNRSSETAE